jgi:undecaprenyl diphosphate synthase
MAKEDGYHHGILPGMELYHICRNLGIQELTFYGFTVDNTKRPSKQRIAFSDACVKAVELLSKENAELLVLGNTKSAMFPKELLPYTSRHIFGEGGIKINFLVNYSYQWDLGFHNGRFGPTMGSCDVSRVDLVIRWGGRRRLSGFLPVQSVYADIYVIEDNWPDFTPQHIYQALSWYEKQDVTLGG